MKIEEFVGNMELYLIHFEKYFKEKIKKIKDEKHFNTAMIDSEFKDHEEWMEEFNAFIEDNSDDILGEEVHKEGIFDGAITELLNSIQ